MKKVILLAMLLTVGLSFGQEKETTEKQECTNQKTTYAIFGFAGNTYGGGLEMEHSYTREKDTYARTLIFNGSNEKLEITRFGITADAIVGELSLGSRNYINKTKETKGFFMTNYLSYGTAKFRETFYSGKYRYLSFFKPEFGYRFQLGNFNLNLFVNTMWKIELKGKRQIENRYHKNWKTKGGLTVGYTF